MGQKDKMKTKTIILVLTLLLYSSGAVNGDDSYDEFIGSSDIFVGGVEEEI
jgi:hypothetical protein